MGGIVTTVKKVRKSLTGGGGMSDVYRRRNTEFANHKVRFRKKKESMAYHRSFGPDPPELTKILKEQMDKIYRPDQDGEFWKEEMLAFMMCCEIQARNAHNALEKKLSLAKKGLGLGKLLGKALEKQAHQATIAHLVKSMVNIYSYLRPCTMTRKLLRGKKFYINHAVGNFGYVTDRYSRDLLELKFSKDGETMKYRYWRERNSPAGTMREFCDSLLLWRIIRVSQRFSSYMLRRKRESYYDRNNSYAYYLVKNKLKAEEEDLKIRRESHIPEKYIYRYMYWVELSYDRDYMIEKYGKDTVDRILEKLEHPIRFHAREAAEAASIAANEAMIIAYKARDHIQEAIRKRKEMEEEAKKEKDGLVDDTNTTSSSSTTDMTTTRRTTIWDFDMEPKTYTSYHPAFLDIQLNSKAYMRFWPENMYKDAVPPVEHRYERYRIDSIETQRGVIGVPNMNKSRFVHFNRVVKGDDYCKKHCLFQTPEGVNMLSSEDEPEEEEREFIRKFSIVAEKHATMKAESEIDQSEELLQYDTRNPDGGDGGVGDYFRALREGRDRG